jgi:predicted thioesterase
MNDIPIGTKGEKKLLVTREVAIDFLGTESARVLSSPNMIKYMEHICQRSLLPLLESGYNTVGTHVDVYHRAASPVGATVTFTSEVIAVDERRIQFRVEARDETDLIGEGTHERTIVDVARFAARLAEKKR